MKRRIQYLALVFVFLLSVGGLFYAAWNLAATEREYKRGEDIYRQIEDDYVKVPEDDSKLPEGKETDPGLAIDFERLQAMNPDIIGWIEIPGAEISYPLLQGSDNSYYLTHLSNGEYGIHGSIFMDYHNITGLSNHNTIIYGHNMKDGTMFAALSDYQNEELYQRYPYFYIYLPDHVIKYQIMSCYYVGVGSVGYTYIFPQEEDFRDFLDTIQSYASYETGTPAELTDHIVTLSTCMSTDPNYRYLIHGKEICKIKEKKDD